MIKNIIFDIGGIIADDSKENIERILHKDCSIIYKKAYGKKFNACLMGEKNVKEYIKEFIKDEDYKDISFILNKENLNITYPIITENLDYIKRLKEQGYKLYLLTNITKDSYIYLNKTINICSIFNGGIYSYQEHLMKPDLNIYNLIIDKYKLNKEETIFFDDREKNVAAALECGIKAVIFKSLIDIENNIK